MGQKLMSFVRALVSGKQSRQTTENWWDQEFTREEIARIQKECYSASGVSDGGIYDSRRNVADQLAIVLGLLRHKDLKLFRFDVARRSVGHVRSISDGLPVEALHFYYMQVCESAYKVRDLSGDGLDVAIQACEWQIAIAPIAAAHFKRKWRTLPAHTGFKRLAVIYEKQRKFADAISICNEAQSQGWPGDWDKRIGRMQKKLGNSGQKSTD